MKTRSILATTIAALLATRAFAATDTWDGGGADNNLSTALNWLDNTAPASDIALTDLIFAGGVRLAPNVSAVFSTNSVVFNNTAGAFSIAGTTLTIGAGGIVNNDADTQTFNNAITLGTATSSFNAASGGLTFLNNVNINANTLALDGAGAFSFGVFFGGGAVNKNGAGTMTWAPNIAQTLDLAINAGTVNTVADATTDVFSAAASIAVNGTGIFNINENLTLDGALLTRATGADFNVAAGKTLTIQNGGDVIVTGAFAHNAAGIVVVTGAGSTFTTTSSVSLNSGSTTNIFAGGSISASGGAVSIGTSGNGTVTVDGSGSSFGGGGLLVIGAAGNTGSVTLSNGATGAFALINAGTTSTAGTNGTLSVQSGAAITGTSLLIAGSSGAVTGTVTINGAGSSLTISGVGAATIGAGSASTGTINVQSGGTFNSGTGAITVNATGTVAITGGTFNANGNMTLNGQMSRDATGVFNLAAGKTLTIQNGGDAIFTGDYATNGGNVTVTGSGSTMQTIAGGFLGIAGGSTVAVQSGGSVISSSSVNIGAGSSGTLTVDGAGSTASAALNSFWGSGAQTANVTFSNAATGSFSGLAIATGSSTGIVQVLTGADVGNSNSLTLANNTTGGNATLTVSGAGSTWTQGGTITLGSVSGSTATLNVQNAGIFSTGTGMTTVNATGQLNITGGTFNANGSVTLNGEGAQLNSTSFGVFNLAAGNSLSVQGGADALITSAYQQMVIANLFVSGAGSTFTTGGDFQWEGAGNTLSILNVSVGGLLSSGGALHLGRTNTAVALTVNGAGSQIVANPASTNEWQAGVLLINGASATLGGLRLADVAFGFASSGSLSVQSGSTVSVGNIAAGSSANDATAAITVTGIGSAITQTGASTFTLGAAFSNTATLDVNNSGVFTSGTGAFTVKGTGTVTINGGTLTVNGALTSTGVFNFTAGTLNLLGSNNLTIGTGGLLGANLTLLSDRTLVVNGTTTVDATRTLTLNGGTLTTGALVNNGTFDFQKGNLNISGAGGLTVGTGPLGGIISLGTGANLSVNNTTTINSGAMLRVDGGSFSGASLTNNGTIDHRNGTLNFTGTLTNNAAGRVFVSGVASPAGAITNSGTITMQNSVGFLGGAGAITNTGLITGDGTIAKPVTNSAAGQIRAEAGKTLTFTGTFAPNAGTVSLQGGTAEFTTAITNAGTGFIAGTGSLRSVNGITNQGVMAFSGGNANVYGDVTNSAGARIITSGGVTTTFFDDVIHNGIEIRTSAGANSVFFGAVSGAGPYTGTGTVYFEGDLRPGNSPASVSFGGDLVLGLGAKTTMEIGGTTPGVQFDHLDVAGAISFDGIFEIALLAGYVPHAGDTYDFVDAATMSGNFSNMLLPSLGGGLSWDTSQLSTNGVIGVVPEPCTATLALLGAAMFSLRRTRRRRHD